MARNIETIWIVTNGNRGNEVICEGVAAALGGEVQSFIIERTPWTQITSPYWPAVLSTGFDRRWQAPWPDIVLASARLAYPPTRHIRTASNGHSFCVALQDPIIHPRHFDLVWAPRHDHLVGNNVISTLLSPHGITSERIAHDKQKWLHLRAPGRRCVGVLIGGPNSAYSYPENECRAFIDQLQKVSAEGFQLIVTTSRRTPDWLTQMLQNALPDAHIATPASESLYPGMLGLVDALIVTPDSVNMTGEACIAGCPVYRPQFKPRRASKFDQFHADLTAQGLVLPFIGVIDTTPRPPRNDTAEIAEAIRLGFAAHRNTTTAR